MPPNHLLFEAVLRAATDYAVIATDLDGIIRVFNEGAARMLGYSADEVIGKHTPLLIHDELEVAAAALDLGVEPGMEVFRVAARRGESETGEWAYLRKDGTRLAVSLSVTGIVDEDGSLSGFLRIARDISDEKKAQQDVARASDRFSKMFRASPVPTTITRADGLFLYVNPAFLRLLGWTTEEIVGRTVHDINSWAHPERRELMLKRLRVEGSVNNLEEDVLTKTGEIRRVLVSAEVIELDGDSCLVVNLQDITQRKAAEDALRAARLEAESANRAKSEFLSRMSHELRTPLNAIIGFGQLLEMDDLSADQEGQVAHVLKAGRYLLDLINEILDLSAIEAGRLTLSIESMAVSAVAREVIDLCSPLAARFEVELSADVDEGLYVMADRQRLKQVLLNLISNAIKYNRPNGSVRVMAEGEDETVRLVVRDTGLGIAPENVERMFAPFERLGAGPEVEGTGLGLALSRRLVNAMGGSLSLASTVGEGSTFYVELARARSHEEAGDDLMHADQSVHLPAGKRILYIEDNLSNLTLVEHLLARYPSVELMTAMQGRMGLELARGQRPDLILLDLHLPDLSGEEVLQHLKADPDTRDIPVLVISADATPRRIDRLLASGAQEFVTKPFDLRRFLGALETTLAGSKQ